MTTNQITMAASHATPEQAQRMLTSLQVFKLQQPTTEEEMSDSKRAVAHLSQPAPRSWISGRIVTMLSHYFVAQQEAAVVKAIADDWAVMLADYPAWAISNACRWWIGMDNPYRARKPLPGDIQDRAHKEMEAVRAAKMVIARGVRAVERQVGPEVGTGSLTEEERLQRASLAAELLRGFGRKD